MDSHLREDFVQVLSDLLEVLQSELEAGDVTLQFIFSLGLAVVDFVELVSHLVYLCHQRIVLQLAELVDAIKLYLTLFETLDFFLFELELESELSGGVVQTDSISVVLQLEAVVVVLR